MVVIKKSSEMWEDNNYPCKKKEKVKRLAEITFLKNVDCYEGV